MARYVHCPKSLAIATAGMDESDAEEAETRAILIQTTVAVKLTISTVKRTVSVSIRVIRSGAQMALARTTMRDVRYAPRIKSCVEPRTSVKR